MHTIVNIAVVEDHDALREMTTDALSNIGCNVRSYNCIESLMDEFNEFSFDLFVLDVNLPGESGVSFACRIRDAQPNVGIIMVTARTRVDDKVEGYASGADIYLAKPTSIKELEAAVKSLARRIGHHNDLQASYKLCLVTLSLQGPKSHIHLTANEISMLSALILAPNNQLEYWQLMESIGDSALDRTKNNLEVLMGRLRKKLILAGASTQPIKAIRGVGYQLCLKVII